VEKRLLSFVVVLFFSLFTKAQTDYHDVPGFYIGFEGDSISGFWQLKSISNSNDSLMLFEFQKAPIFKFNDGRMKEIKPEDGYRRIGYQYQGQWRTWYRVNRKDDLANKAPRGEYLFAQRVVIGKIEVFGVILKGGASYESMAGETDRYAANHIFHKKGTTGTYYLATLNFNEKKVKKLVKDCPKALEWYKAHENRMASQQIYELVILYNQNCP
jgi:hypothetical protein